jgi:1,4-alpha-glucan branching enzyme
VAVAGDFNQWSASGQPLVRDSGGRWTVSMKLAPGTCHYRFVVDGDRWVEDPLNTERAPNDYGTFNSIRLVSE